MSLTLSGCESITQLIGLSDKFEEHNNLGATTINVAGLLYFADRDSKIPNLEIAAGTNNVGLFWLGVPWFSNLRTGDLLKWLLGAKCNNTQRQHDAHQSCAAAVTAE